MFFNFTCHLTNQSDKAVEIRRLEAKVTNAGERVLDFSWDLFFETSGTRMHKVDHYARIRLPPGSSKQLGVQFRGTSFDPENVWLAADYEFQLLGWVDREPGEEKANLKTLFRVRVTEAKAQEIRRWMTAGDAEWKRLNDPDDAVAIQVPIRDLKTGL